MSPLSQKILAKIHSQKIIPESRWHFIALHTVLWVCFIVTLVVGTLSVSLLLLEMNMPERLYFEWMSESRSTTLLQYLPFLWAIGAILCLGVGYFLFSKTERGYRVSTLWLTGTLILGSSIGGFALYHSNVAEIGEKNMRHFIPPYERLRSEFRQGMPLPESGLLPGRIESLSDTSLTIKSPDRNIWKISLDCKNEACKETQKNLTKDQPMLFIGKIKGDTRNREFEATDIEPPPRGKMQKGPRKGERNRE